MNFREFIILLDKIDLLDNRQFRIIKEKVLNTESLNFVSNYIETHRHEINCSHCGSHEIKRWGKRSGLQRYKCKSCNKTFNSLTGTPLARLRKKGRWLNYAHCIKDGDSVRKAALKCGVHYNTTFKWRHRFLENSINIRPETLNGIIESMNIVLPKSYKGQKIKQNKIKEKICVIFARDRNGNEFDKIVNRLNIEELNNNLKKVLSSDSLFCSNNHPVYIEYTQQNNMNHNYVNLTDKQTENNNYVHLNNVVNYKDKLIEWMSRFRGVATKYLDNYISWFRELDEYNYNINPYTLLYRAKLKNKYKEQPLTMI